MQHILVDPKQYQTTLIIAQAVQMIGEVDILPSALPFNIISRRFLSLLHLGLCDARQADIKTNISGVFLKTKDGPKNMLLGLVPITIPPF